MFLFTIELLFTLLVILASAEIFTNALENFGERFGISEGTTGSLFAAIGTALPETLVPILAIFAGTSDIKTNEEISVGAILGAPLMLSTLTIFMMGIAAIKKRGINGKITPEITGFSRDMNFFLLAFSLAALAMFIPHDNLFIRMGLSVVCLSFYPIYIFRTVSSSKQLVEEGHGTVAEHSLFFTRIGLKDNDSTIIIQLIFSLAALIMGAKFFVHAIGGTAKLLEISPLLISLLIIPIATELPEKINSILWIRRGKDTLAFGNITGAMVFQGSLLPAIGIMITPWQADYTTIIGIIITLISAVWLRLHANEKGITILNLMPCGILYFAYWMIMIG